MASRTLRRAYLGLQPVQELNTICMSVLDAIGASRDTGMGAMELGQAVQQSAKNLFTHLQRLESFRLVFRDMRTHKSHQRVNNRIWLSRYRVKDTIDQRQLVFGLPTNAEHTIDRQTLYLTTPASSSSSSLSASHDFSLDARKLAVDANLARTKEMSTDALNVLLPRVAPAARSLAPAVLGDVQRDVVPLLLPLIQRAPQGVIWEDELRIAHVSSHVQYFLESPSQFMHIFS